MGNSHAFHQLPDHRQQQQQYSQELQSKQNLHILKNTRYESIRRKSTPITVQTQCKRIRQLNRISSASDHSNTTSTDSAPAPSLIGGTAIEHHALTSTGTECSDSNDGVTTDTARALTTTTSPIAKQIKFLKRAKAVTAMDANERRLRFVSSHGSLTMSSVEAGEVSNVEVVMKPLKDRSRSMSPLRKFRTCALRLAQSKENILSDLQQNMIHHSWQKVLSKLEEQQPSQTFGHFVFRRVFARNPKIRSAFNVENYQSLDHLPLDHAINRHFAIFQRLFALTVHNLDELETEIAPAIFRYGQRHYVPKVKEVFNEENVRLVCSQVVCAVADLIEVDVNPICMEAWIELMRYIGNNLIEGFNCERIIQTKKAASD